MDRTVLKTVWNSPPRMRFTYKRNSNAVYSVSMKKKEEQERTVTEIKTENRFAGFEDSLVCFKHIRIHGLNYFSTSEDHRVKLSRRSCKIRVVSL